MKPIITLTTDFGTHDSYVGVMKGVIATICPDAHIIDITHEIPPQDLNATLFTLETFLPYFPTGTIHVVVVDPGVGGARRPIGLKTPEATFIGPDNGIFGDVWNAARTHFSPNKVRVIELNERRFWRPMAGHISHTFHGRDIFSPVAAHLAQGVPFEAIGTPLDDIITMPTVQPEWHGNTTLVGQVIAIDHFGNAITNLTVEHLKQLGSLNEIAISIVIPPTLSAPPASLPISRTYADVAMGEPLALIGSTPRLEIAVCNGNAASSLHLSVGTSIKAERTVSVPSVS